MGKRGPQPTPTNILKLHNSRRVEGRKDEPKPDILTELPKVPGRLKATAARFYADAGRAVIALKVLSSSDIIKLVLMSEVYGQYRQACRSSERYGVIIKSMGKMVRNPALGARNESLRLLNAMMGEFGLSPSSRTKLVDVSEKETKDPFAELSRRGRKKQG